MVKFLRKKTFTIFKRRSIGPKTNMLIRRRFLFSYCFRVSSLYTTVELVATEPFTADPISVKEHFYLCANQNKFRRKKLHLNTVSVLLDVFVLKQVFSLKQTGPGKLTQLNTRTTRAAISVYRDR